MAVICCPHVSRLAHSRLLIVHCNLHPRLDKNAFISDVGLVLSKQEMTMTREDNEWYVTYVPFIWLALIIYYFSFDICISPSTITPIPIHSHIRPPAAELPPTHNDIITPPVTSKSEASSRPVTKQDLDHWPLNPSSPLAKLKLTLRITDRHIATNPAFSFPSPPPTAMSSPRRFCVTTYSL
jgi:hypothetical protein